LPMPEDVPHQEGAPVRVLIRPEQVMLTQVAPTDRPALGRGRTVETSFAGALRRVRLRIPRLPRTRQITPPTPYGEEGLLIEAVLPASEKVPEEAYVSLSGWRILEQPRPSLLVADAVNGASPPVEAARPFAAALDASIVALGVVADSEPPETLREKLKSQYENEATEIRVRAGQPAEQIRNEQAESFYDLALLGAPGRQAVRTASLRRLLRESSTPLLFGTPREKLERILICTAVGEPGKGDVRVGGWVAGRMGARVTLLHVSRDAAAPPPFIRAHLDQGVATLTAFDVSAEARIRRAASPVEGILFEARRGDYDLVVIGGHGPRSRSLTARDDVTLQILDSVKRPVLVVPEDSG
jgi:nucleotide-binding universal stress UspA family protein